ncbi:MAG: hypothetical protein R2715_00515 [Ilumatobacteraceae bacterium]
MADDAPVVEIPGDLQEGIIERFRAALGDAVVGSHLLPGKDVWIRVTAESWRAAAEAAKAHGFDYFCFLSAIDWLPSPFGKGEEDPTADPVEPTPRSQGYAGGETASS